MVGSCTLVVPPVIGRLPLGVCIPAASTISTPTTERHLDRGRPLRGRQQREDQPEDDRGDRDLVMARLVLF